MRAARQELLEDLASRIAKLRSEHPVRVAIDGVDAAGKTTLSDDPRRLAQAESPAYGLPRTIAHGQRPTHNRPRIVRPAHDEEG